MSHPQRPIDLPGAVALIGFSALLGFNQVVIRVVNEGLQPVFFAGLRSAGALFCVYLWLWARNKPMHMKRAHFMPGIALGAVFAAEFVFLFLALDYTTVTRTSVIFYTMPLWLAVMGHFLLPGESMTRAKAAGLVLAFSGVAVAILWRGGGGGEASLLGDILALLAAMAWAGIALLVRATALRSETPEVQLLWQLSGSAIILLVLSPLFGPLIRDLQTIHFWGLAFQIVAIASAGYAFWLWLLTIYPAAGVASFSFLAPIFGVAFGWLLLGETLSPAIIVALILVCAGLILINRPPRQVPQKVRATT